MGRKAKIDDRLVSLPEIKIDENVPGRADTIFTVEGKTPWGSASEYEVHLNGPSSYYKYGKSVKIGEDVEGNAWLLFVKDTGNDKNTLNRYRKYLQQLRGSDYWSAWKRLFNNLPNIPLKKSNGGRLVKINGKLVEIAE